MLAAGLLLTGLSCRPDQAVVDREVGPHEILPDYVDRADSSYRWAVVQRVASDTGTFVQVALTSQRWRDSTWEHQLFAYFPAAQSQTSTMFLSLQTAFTAEQARTGLMQVARATGVPCAILTDVPNQPLFGGKLEEELLNYTFERYLETGEQTWPLLLPMVKGAVRAMDALQAVGEQTDLPTPEHFIVAGHSKRGHTAWLTAAVDPRVTGLIAQGFNTLHATAQIPHYLATYGELDQSALAAKNVIGQMNSPRGRDLLRIVDAYTYRDRLTQPKLVVVGTNDDYTPVDALNLYWPGLPGPKSVLSLPNAGHVAANGDPRLFPTAYAFIRAVADGRSLPSVGSKVTQEKGVILLAITADTSARGARMWTARSPTRDFRSARWEASYIPPTGPGGRSFEGTVIRPEKGFVALIGEVDFGTGDRPFQLSTVPYVIVPPRNR